jgi:hypothetical protein
MAKKPVVKKTSVVSPPKVLSPTEQVKEKFEKAESVKVADKFLIVSKKSKPKDYSEFALSGLCKDEDGAWKQALHRLL